MDAAFEPETAELFGEPEVLYACEGYYPDPYGEGYLCDFHCWTWDETAGESATLLLAEDCRSGTVTDLDGDGENEAVIRTRWPEKPYTVYDLVDGKLTETWPDTVPEDVRTQLLCPWEQ